MAKSITNIEMVPTDPAAGQAQAMTELLGAIASNKEPLLQFLDILNEMHELGLLDILQGLLKNGHEVGVIGIAQLNKPGAQHMIKNGMSALQFIGNVDPAGLEKIMNGVQSGLRSAGSTLSDKNKPVGLFEMLRMMKDKDMNNSLRFMMSFMRGMGSGMNKNVH